MLCALDLDSPDIFFKYRIVEIKEVPLFVFFRSQLQVKQPKCLQSRLIVTGQAGMALSPLSCQFEGQRAKM